MSNLKLDFVLYLGDPDQGAAIVSGAKALEKIDEYKSKLAFAQGVYGAITVEKGGKPLAEKKPDPALPLVTSFVRTIPYVIEGEPETALLSESEFGFMFEPAGDDILVSYFSGDAYNPDEYIIERESMPLESFAEQVIGMGERLVSLIRKCEPDLLSKDDYSKTLLELLDMGKSAFRTFRLERERGLRR